ncbi:MAG: hypothetical protein M3Z33_10405 [Actinomycetota bacterium]|nr:hypothetical protein [Actinomycetota bacterium]
MSNVFGQARALTVLTPILSGREAALAGYLSALPAGAESPLADAPRTHFARWVVIDALVYQGPPQRRDQLGAARLLFTSNFDGDLDSYLEGLRTGMGERADEVWGHCAGYPGHDHPGRFAAYLRAHALDSDLFFAAYGDLTVEKVRVNLELRERLVAFVMRSQGLEDEPLQQAFLREFPDA